MSCVFAWRRVNFIISEWVYQWHLNMCIRFINNMYNNNNITTNLSIRKSKQNKMEIYVSKKSRESKIYLLAFLRIILSIFRFTRFLYKLSIPSVSYRKFAVFDNGWIWNIRNQWIRPCTKLPWSVSFHYLSKILISDLYISEPDAKRIYSDFDYAMNCFKLFLNILCIYDILATNFSDKFSHKHV